MKSNRCNLLFLALLSLAGFANAADTQAVRPNVIILLTDDQGTLDANCYGSTDLQTPHMDKLAGTGIRFTQAYAQTVCCPARAALFTGRHPQRGGVRSRTQGDRHGSDRQNLLMAEEEVTLAEVLKSAGYRTALFGKWHLGAKVGHGPLNQGFETYFGHLGGFIDNCGVKHKADAPKLDGHSMTGVIADPTAASAYQILNFAWASNWAVRRGDWKLINHLNKKTKTMELSLHNLAEDQPEVKDHAKEQPKMVKELMALHEGWQKDLESK